MHDGRYWWLSTGFLLLSTGGTLLYLQGRSENQVKLAKSVIDACLALWSIGSILALAPKPGPHGFDLKIAMEVLPIWLSRSLIAAVLLLVSSKVAVAIVEARLARRKVMEDWRRRALPTHDRNVVAFAPPHRGSLQ